MDDSGGHQSYDAVVGWRSGVMMIAGSSRLRHARSLNVTVGVFTDAAALISNTSRLDEKLEITPETRGITSIVFSLARMIVSGTGLSLIQDLRISVL